MGCRTHPITSRKPCDTLSPAAEGQRRQRRNAWGSPSNVASTRLPVPRTDQRESDPIAPSLTDRAAIGGQHVPQPRDLEGCLAVRHEHDGLAANRPGGVREGGEGRQGGGGGYNGRKEGPRTQLAVSHHRSRLRQGSHLPASIAARHLPRQSGVDPASSDKPGAPSDEYDRPPSRATTSNPGDPWHDLGIPAERLATYLQPTEILVRAPVLG